MLVIEKLDSPSLIKMDSVAAIGVFDGVHLGHKRVIKEAVTLAKKSKARSVVITFDRHPMKVVKPGSRPQTLTSRIQKEKLIAKLGVDVLLVIEFDLDLAALAPDMFMDMICDRVGIIAIVVGENFRYGSGASGDLPHLEKYGRKRGIEVIGVPLLAMDGQIISSTRVRKLLAMGDIEGVGRVLGRCPLVTGKVVSGHGRGGTLGYHTANIETKEKAMMPKEGVYGGYFTIGGKRFKGAVNIGKNPTFDGTHKQLEVYILDFDEDIYGAQVELEFRFRVRDEIKFASPKLLVKQMKKDIEAIRRQL